MKGRLIFAARIGGERNNVEFGNGAIAKHQSNAAQDENDGGNCKCVANSIVLRLCSFSPFLCRRRLDLANEAIAPLGNGFDQPREDAVSAESFANLREFLHGPSSAKVSGQSALRKLRLSQTC